jgi:hypothetical protein
LSTEAESFIPAINLQCFPAKIKNPSVTSFFCTKKVKKIDSLILILFVFTTKASQFKVQFRDILALGN